MNNQKKMVYSLPAQIAVFYATDEPEGLDRVLTVTSSAFKVNGRYGLAYVVARLCAARDAQDKRDALRFDIWMEHPTHGWTRRVTEGTAEKALHAISADVRLMRESIFETVREYRGYLNVE